MPFARRPGRGKPAKRGRRTGGAATTPRTESREQAPAAAVQHAVIAGDVTWTPPFRSVFLFLFGMRVWGAVVNTISDCDEVYNYWEPTHQLMYGRGFQTWEYSPQYALRSYIYVGAHAVVGKALAFIVGSESPKFAMFYALRCFLAVTCAFSEACLYEVLAKRVSKLIALVAVVFMGTSAGMFAASSAFLPSTFTMYAVMWAYTAWLQDRYALTLLAGSVGVLIGWPFAGVVFVPMGLHMIAKAGLGTVIVWGLVWSALLLGLSAAVDHHFYHAWLLPVWNIVKYNALGGGGGDGSNLYGTEPATYYFRNLTLNFNGVFPLALLSVFALLDKRFGGALGRVRTLALLSPFWLWFGLMTAREHKEERFLFVVYPLLCIAAAMTVVAVRRGLQSAERSYACFQAIPRVARLSNVLLYAIVAVAAVMSASRSVAVISNYAAPMQGFAQLANQFVPKFAGVSASGASGTAVVCIGKEWYRFPSSFFLPDAPVRAELRFLPSSFHGQLPQPYAAENATWVVQPGFNDLNQEDPTRYTTVDQCDFIVDLHLADQAEEPYSASPDWEVVWSAPFLDAARSPTLTRAFFVPKLVQRNVYASYEVLQRKVVQSVPAPVSGRRRRQRVSSEEEADELEFVPTPASDLDAEL